MAERDSARGKPTGIGAIRTLDYVFILCDDLERMKAFYVDLFGFEVQEETPGKMIELRVGGLFLGLRSRGRRYDGPNIPEQSASIQLSFRVPPSDVDGAYATLKARGIDVIEPPTNQEWPHRTLYFHDPENNILEIFADIDEDLVRSEASGVHAVI